MGILHVDVVIDGILVTDGRKHPMGIHRVDSIVTAVGVGRRVHIVTESVGIGHDDGRTAVDLVAEHDRVEIYSVIVGKFRTDGERSELVVEGSVGVIIKGRLHEDTRRNELAVGKG